MLDISDNYFCIFLIVLSCWPNEKNKENYNFAQVHQGKSQKKSSFLVARPQRPLALPSALWPIGTIFLILKKNLFSLVAQQFAPPLIVARPLRKQLFFAA